MPWTHRCQRHFRLSLDNSVHERWLVDNEISPATVKSEGLDDSLEVPANLDDTLITPRAAVSSLHHDTASLPQLPALQFLRTAHFSNKLPDVWKTSPVLFSSISSSVFIHAESVFLVRRVPGEGKYLGQQIQSMNPNLNLEENDFLQLP